MGHHWQEMTWKWDPDGAKALKERLEARRGEKARIARAANVGSSTVTAWISTGPDGSPPNPDHLRVLADELEVSADELLGRAVTPDAISQELQLIMNQVQKAKGAVQGILLRGTKTRTR